SKNNLFLATKSVSELSSNKTAMLFLIYALAIPSAAILPDFLAALIMPFSCNQAIAFSIS
ncbi:hypothetical protein CP01DC11_1181B, partial [Chlamydia psittaci 01DC11]